MENNPLLCEVYILKTDSGEIRSLEDFKLNESWWSDGNGSCDCNRRRMFERVIKVELSEDEIECGDDLFKVHIEDVASRTVIYSEFDEQMEELLRVFKGNQINGK